MPISDIEPSTKTVPLHKGSFLVKGLSFDDLTTLVSNFYPDLSKLSEMISAVKEKSGMAGLLSEDFVMNVAVQVPALVGHVILLGAKHFDANLTEIQVRGLSFPIQVLAVKDIITLTFEDVGGPKAFADLVKKIATAMKSEIGGLITVN